MLNETARNYAVSGIEPTLREALNDPSVQLLMARDGVTRSDVRLLIQALRNIRSTPTSGHTLST